MSGCTITAPAKVASSADAYLRLSRKLTSSGPAVCSGATPVSCKPTGGAAPHAVSATVARECGPQRAKKRGSPIGVRVIVPPHRLMARTPVGCPQAAPGAQLACAERQARRAEPMDRTEIGGGASAHGPLPVRRPGSMLPLGRATPLICSIPYTAPHRTAGPTRCSGLITAERIARRNGHNGVARCSAVTRSDSPPGRTCSTPGRGLPSVHTAVPHPQSAVVARENGGVSK